METKIILPEILFYNFIWALNYRISYQYQKKPVKDMQIWYNIPVEERNVISLDQLEHSVFGKMKELIGMEFNTENVLITDGKYWLEQIRKAVNSYDEWTEDCQTIYVFDKKMQLVVFYLEEFNDLFIWGPNARLLLK